jgi:hypothetical protein
VLALHSEASVMADQAPLVQGSEVEVPPGTAANAAVLPKSFAGIESASTPRMPPRSNSEQGLPALNNSPPKPHSRGGSMNNIRSSAFRERDMKVQFIHRLRNM